MKPGVSAAILLRVGVGGEPHLLQVDVEDLRRGPSCRAGRPAPGGRSGPRAAAPGSRISGRLVAASRTTPLDGSKPSISTSSWFSVCSFSSWPPMPAAPARAAQRVELVDEDDGRRPCRACSNRSRTRAAPTPTNISTNSEPLIEKNGTPASPATARASSVLPVPGGPTSRTPFGHARAEPAVALRILEEVDDLVQLLLGLVDAGDVVEGDLGVGLDVDLGLALADREEPAAQSPLFAHAPHEIDPDGEEDERRHDPRQDVAQESALDDTGELDVVLREILGELRIDPRRDEARTAVRLRLLCRCPAPYWPRWRSP